MNLIFLPEKIRRPLLNVNMDKVYQIRLRVNQYVLVFFEKQYLFLADDGLSKENSNAIKCDERDINFVISVVTEKSLYAYNEKLVKGYLDYKDGIRIGIGGSCVYNNGQVVTIKNISSLNIRFPHQIYNCSNEIFNFIYNENKVYNTLIVSAPFCGKTTLLKDIAIKIDNKINRAILIIDERGEFSNIFGANIDKLCFCDKKYAFDNGIRSLSPNVVITDELQNEKDWQCAYDATNSGVNIIASCHASNISQVYNKKEFIKDVFNRYIVLKNDDFGQLDSVYDGDFKIL